MKELLSAAIVPSSTPGKPHWIHGHETTTSDGYAVIKDMTFGHLALERLFANKSEELFDKLCHGIRRESIEHLQDHFVQLTKKLDPISLGFGRQDSDKMVKNLLSTFVTIDVTSSLETFLDFADTSLSS